MKRSLLPVALLVLAAAGWLRLHELSGWSLDGDELYSHYDVETLLGGGRWPEGARSHPLGYVAMAAGVALLGPGEGALRLVPALCGIGAVACLLFLRRAAVGAGTGLIAGSLAAVSPWLVYHAQEARFYGPLLLFATLATLWALPGPGDRPRAAVAAWFAAVLCHTSALALGPCLLLGRLRSRPSGRQVAIGLLLVAAAFALWMLIGGGAVLDVVMAAVRRTVLARYDAVHFVAGLGYNLGVGTCVLLLAGLAAVRRGPSDGDRMLLLAALLPPAALLLGALLGVSMHPRYAMASVPAALLLAGRGALALSGRRAALAGAVALAALAPLPELAANLRCGDRADYRAAATWIAAHVPQGDLVVADEHALLELYLRRETGREDAETTEESLTERQRWTFLRHRKDCWLVLKSSRMGGAYGEDFDAWVSASFEPVARLGSPPPPFARHDNTLLVFRRRARVTDKTPPPGPPAGTPPR